MSVNIKEILTNFDPLNTNPLEIRATVDAMLENLCTLDEDTRENLLLPIFTRFIKGGHLPATELSRVLDICASDDYLFFEIEKESDAVFKRASSAVIISALIDYNSRQSFISVVKLDELVGRILLYLMREEDARSYVISGGWARAFTNGFDLLGSLVADSDVSASRFPDFLTAIESCLFKKMPFYNFETLGAAEVVRLMMERGMGLAHLSTWTGQMIDRLNEFYDAKGFTHKFQSNFVNVSSFLRDLYFNFKKDSERIKLRVAIYADIKSLHKLEKKIRGC